MKPKTIVCDIDDTLITEPSYKPIENVVEFIQQMAQTYKIILMTARFEDERDFTIQQMRNLKIPFDELIMESDPHPNHKGKATVEHGIWKAGRILERMDQLDIVLFIDNNPHAREEVKKLGIRTKKPENISNKILTKTVWSGIFI